jgi:hypothetical protein
MELHLSLIDPLPELADVVVIVGNQMQPSVFISQPPELGTNPFTSSP